ncbi:nucleoside hydrolase [Sulfuracidifex metallicus]|uniref:Nucleoside hydrolase n=1 Tax=Sulfuracidifex metallicus DSM 6482 = JCM 9184 TaxID=523847 RepID=A0A6A9QNL9_SULME|nr:nucleoside hydrolase [Sulfuracidifex metallicus]MUN29338.1 nucleoside hydrolase [Sulfuracidifex metallicus DSM 6482 = JCM 9184]WOE50150.1 nucleoside hydrolase [Sulfuracidifex metallicus DSM 6482 = JCM 9184]
MQVDKYLFRKRETPTLIDSDTASDDTTAITLASALTNLKAITVVAGNVKFENEIKNAIFTKEYLSLNVPIYAGSRRPLLGIWRTVEEVHGTHGMGNINQIEVKGSVENEFASDAIISLARKYQGELEVFAVSPLTNLALAFLKEPTLPSLIKKIWIMGGAFSRGNTSPLAEFNFWTDPESAQIVLNAGFDITIVPWEVTEESAIVYDDEWEEIKSLGTRRSYLFIKANEIMREFSKSKEGLDGSVHPDSLTVSISYDNSIAVKTSKFYVNVETCGMSRGGMLVDWYNMTGNKPNAEIVLKADREKFVKLLISVLSA